MQNATHIVGGRLVVVGYRQLFQFAQFQVSAQRLLLLLVLLLRAIVRRLLGATDAAGATRQKSRHVAANACVCK